MADDIEIGSSPRSSAHVILHPQPPRPAGKPDYWMATACGHGLHGIAHQVWVTPAEALKSVRCRGCVRHLKSLVA